MRHVIRHPLLGLTLLFLLATGCDPQGRARPAGPPVPEVATITVAPAALTLTSELPGRTAPHLIAEIRPQVSGIIQQRLFDEGAEIRAGQVLYQIDPAPFQAAYDNAAANLAAARKAADRARAALQASRAAVLREQAVRENARTNRKRFDALAAEGAVAVSQRDQAATDFDVAAAAVQTAEAQVTSDREAVGVADAAVQQAEAALQTARINLDYARVTAPIAGRIGRSAVTVGAYATAGQATALATIQQLDPIYVDATESSANLLRLRESLATGKLKGDGAGRARVRLLLEDGTPYPLEGTLQFSDVTVDPTTGSFILRSVFPNPRRLLLPGMYVRIVLQEGVVEQAILIPQPAVSRDPKGTPLAMVVNAAGTVEQRTLQVDRAIGASWLVAQGLQAGDQVIVAGLQRVRPGATVKTTPAPPQPAPAAAAPAAAR